jgi:hypothetical protein
MHASVIREVPRAMSAEVHWSNLPLSSYGPILRFLGFVSDLALSKQTKIIPGLSQLNVTP